MPLLIAAGAIRGRASSPATASATNITYFILMFAFLVVVFCFLGDASAAPQSWLLRPAGELAKSL
jgi:hypothetical protein